MVNVVGILIFVCNTSAPPPRSASHPQVRIMDAAAVLSLISRLGSLKSKGKTGWLHGSQRRVLITYLRSESAKHRNKKIDVNMGGKSHRRLTENICLGRIPLSAAMITSSISEGVEGTFSFRGHGR